LFLRVVLLMACVLSQASCRGLSPAYEQLEAPPVLVASADTDLSVLDEPCILKGLTKERWILPDGLLSGHDRALRVDLMPVDCAEAPLKLADGTLVGPASVPFAMADVLPMLRRSAEERGFHAYVRHISLDSFPDVVSQLPMNRALSLAGPRLQSANLWIGDGGMRSNLHWDGHDNILLQLTGTKTLLILPPEAAPHVNYTAFVEHKYTFDGRNFTGFSPTGVIVENHALFDTFDPARTQLPSNIPLERARVATLHPGEALFLPALWSHAVVSTPAKEEDVSRGLNIAVNIWFVHRSLSHAAALKHHPKWTQGWFVYANDLRAAGLRNPLNNILYVYIYTHI
jgi:hypothetical protein